MKEPGRRIRARKKDDDGSRDERDSTAGFEEGRGHKSRNTDNLQKIFL